MRKGLVWVSILPFGISHASCPESLAGTSTSSRMHDRGARQADGPSLKTGSWLIPSAHKYRTKHYLGFLWLLVLSSYTPFTVFLTCRGYSHVFLDMAECAEWVDVHAQGSFFICCIEPIFSKPPKSLLHCCVHCTAMNALYSRKNSKKAIPKPSTLMDLLYVCKHFNHC